MSINWYICFKGIVNAFRLIHSGFAPWWTGIYDPHLVYDVAGSLPTLLQCWFCLSMHMHDFKLDCPCDWLPTYVMQLICYAHLIAHSSILIPHSCSSVYILDTLCVLHISSDGIKNRSHMIIWFIHSMCLSTSVLISYTYSRCLLLRCRFLIWYAYTYMY